MGPPENAEPALFHLEERFVSQHHVLGAEFVVVGMNHPDPVVASMLLDARLIEPEFTAFQPGKIAAIPLGGHQPINPLGIFAKTLKFFVQFPEDLLPIKPLPFRLFGVEENDMMCDSAERPAI
jgi:hypothetical protein